MQMKCYIYCVGLASLKDMLGEGIYYTQGVRVGEGQCLAESPTCPFDDGLEGQISGVIIFRLILYTLLNN